MAVKFYCEVCKKSQPIIIEPFTVDELNEDKSWGDIICSACRLVIATCTVDEPGQYDFIKVMWVKEDKMTKLKEEFWGKRILPYMTQLMLRRSFDEKCSPSEWLEQRKQEVMGELTDIENEAIAEHDEMLRQKFD